MMKQTNVLSAHDLRHKKNIAWILKRYWQLYLLLLLPLVYLILFKYVPMLGIQIAFKKFKARDGIWGSQWVGLKNFDKFFNSYMFERVIGNTLRLSIYSLLAGFPLPIIFALMLNAMRSKHYRSFIENVAYMPHFISTVVMVGILMQVFDSRIGVFARLYTLFTGSKDVPSLFSSAAAFPHLYVWSGIWQGLGWDTVIYTAALAAVDLELHEAALIDGATRFQRLLHVDLPGIIPTITITLILRCGHIMGIGFDKVYLMQNNMNLKASEVIATYVYKQGLTGSSDYSYSTAISLFNSVINLALITLVNFVSRKVSDTSLW
ncbi:MAG: ABC transporter permease subunit [Clostridia bacterium]|nr:ABC transporter permease subunit [Clostridia bacterium]